MLTLVRAMAVIVLMLKASPSPASDTPVLRGLSAPNWREAADLLPDPVLQRVRAGDYEFVVAVVDDDRFRQNYPQRYWAASEANEGLYDVDRDTCGLKRADDGKLPEHVFGQPFPRIDPADPMAGCKVAWNFYLANQIGGGQGATFTLNGVDRNGEFRRIKMWLHTNAYMGRPEPIEQNPENLRAAQISHAMEPADAEGVNILAHSINDWEQPDSIWAYLPQTRRVRRVNAATRSDPIAGLDIFADDLNCYAGKPEYYEWELVGDQRILAPIIGPYAFSQKPVGDTRSEVDVPYLRAGYETPGSKGAPWQVTENLLFVERPVWKLRGQSRDPYYNFGPVTMYVDKEMSRIYWKNVHNRAGEYFYTAMCGYHWSKSEDGAFGSTAPSLVLGVNDKADRAALGGRYEKQFIEREFDASHFSIRALSRLAD